MSSLLYRWLAQEVLWALLMREPHQRPSTGCCSYMSRSFSSSLSRVVRCRRLATGKCQLVLCPSSQLRVTFPQGLMRQLGTHGRPAMLTSTRGHHDIAVSILPLAVTSAPLTPQVRTPYSQPHPSVLSVWCPLPRQRVFNQSAQ